MTRAPSSKPESRNSNLNFFDAKVAKEAKIRKDFLCFLCESLLPSRPLRQKTPCKKQCGHKIDFREPERIAVDALAMTTPMTGVSTIIAEILRALKEPGFFNPAQQNFYYNQVDAYHLPPTPSYMPAFPRRAKNPAEVSITTYGSSLKLPRFISWMPKLERIVAEQFLLPLLLAFRKTRTLLAPAYVAPLLAPCDVWLIVHDLHVYTHPKTCSLLNRLHYKLLMPFSLRKAKRVFVLSRHVRDILVARFPHVTQKVEVLPVGIPHDRKRVDDALRLKAYRLHHGLPEKFFLFVGSLHPRKNLPRLMEAMLRLPEDATLVMAGPQNTDARRVQKMLRSHPNKFKWLDYVSQDGMTCLYSMARALVLPSLDEGLGLPVLEAMACHCPVLATPGPAHEFFPEALLCDPESVDSIKNNLLRLWQDDPLCHELSQKAAQHAQKLSWKNTATVLQKDFNPK